MQFEIMPIMGGKEKTRVSWSLSITLTTWHTSLCAASKERLQTWTRPNARSCCEPPVRHHLKPSDIKLYHNTKKEQIIWFVFMWERTSSMVETFHPWKNPVGICLFHVHNPCAPAWSQLANLLRLAFLLLLLFWGKFFFLPNMFLNEKVQHCYRQSQIKCHLKPHPEAKEHEQTVLDSFFS